MEYYFFVIIVIIVLKVLFWTFYFYVRAQRMRQLENAQGVIIVDTRRVIRRPAQISDRSAIINHAEPVSMTGPPPYSEVVKEGPPPSYSQAAASYPAPPPPPASAYTEHGNSQSPLPPAAYTGGFPEQLGQHSSNAYPMPPTQAQQTSANMQSQLPTSQPQSNLLQ